jgi:hypothetical protein
MKNNLTRLRLRLLIAGLSPRRDRFASGSVRVGFVVDKWHWDTFLAKFFGCRLLLLFHRGYPYSDMIWGMNNKPVSGRSSETSSTHQREQKKIVASLINSHDVSINCPLRTKSQWKRVNVGPGQENVNDSSVRVVRSRSRWCNSYRACHWTQGSRIQTRPRAMNF